MNATEFFLKYNNKPLDADGANGFQCVDVIKQYFKEVLNLPVFQGNAIDYWKNNIQGFTKIPYQKGLQATPGDIIVTDIPPYGHISICNWSRIADFGAFEQNYPLGSPCHYQDHPNYNKVLGFLRPNHVDLGDGTRPHIPNNQPQSKFVMEFDCFNTDPNLLEQARQLLIKYSDGLLDCKFNFKTISPITISTLWTSDLQVEFLKVHPIQVPFGILFYQGNDPGHTDARTSTSPGSDTILIASFPNTTAFYMCYEMAHAITLYLLNKGLPIGLPNDVFTPNEAFLQQKFITILPYLRQLLK